MRKAVCILGMIISVLLVQGQVKMSDLKVKNPGDGRMYAEYREDEKPVNGKIRIITEYTTEYLNAEFSEGLATGKWEHYKDNTLAEVTHYADGYLHGELIRYYSDGKTVREKTTMKNGKVNGTTRAYSDDGKLIYEKGLKDGVDDGPERRYDKNGGITSETIYVNGKANGKSIQKINIGNPDEYTVTQYYKNGKHDGDFLEVFENGTIKTKGKYIDGQKDGLWEAFKKHGSRRGNAETYKNGKVVKKTTYYADGNIEMERNFNTDGKQHGVEKKYATNGKDITSEKNFVNGKQVGKQMRLVSSNQGNFYEYANYNEAGKKDGDFLEVFEKNKKEKTKGKYTNDQKDGKWYYGNSLGFYKEETYDKGKLIDSKSLIKD